MSVKPTEDVVPSAKLTKSLKRLPPLVGHLRIPTDSRGAALAGIALYPACRPLAVWCQKAAYHFVRFFGPRLLPGTTGWEPPCQAPWQELCALWRSEVGKFDTVAICDRRQTSRSGFGVLLVHEGEPIGFVKVWPGTSSGHEYLALRCVEAYRSRILVAPRPIACGECFGWSYLAMTPLPLGIHRRPRKPPIHELTDEVRDALNDLPRPSGSPGHWQPMHGDMTPWNLRCTADDGLILMDWEEASWGPPGADEVYYHATEAVLGNTNPLGVEGSSEAIDYWIGKLSNRSENSVDRRKTRSLVKSLEWMRDKA